MSDIPCPTCGRVNEVHERAPGQSPEPGDVSLCWGCGALAIFTDEGVRLPNAEELASIEADPELARVRAAIVAAAAPSQALDVLWGSS